jgi:hypothetical protein
VGSQPIAVDALNAATEEIDGVPQFYEQMLVERAPASSESALSARQQTAQVPGVGRERIAA